MFTRPFLSHVAFAALSMLALLPTFLAAQPPDEDCAGSIGLDGAHWSPFVAKVTPATDDFTMTGTNCAEAGEDNVLCFVPENTCIVDISCNDLAGAVAVNLFAGTCTPSPGSCLASASGIGAASISGRALVGGNSYCVVCEYAAPASSQVVIVQTAGTNCGNLPVTLQTFDIESTAEASAGDESRSSDRSQDLH
jgi:hypothetical protein